MGRCDPINRTPVSDSLCPFRSSYQSIIHLTEKQKLLQGYDFYHNMSGRKSFAEFEYTFVFDEHEVVYKYRNVETKRLNESVRRNAKRFPESIHELIAELKQKEIME